MNPGNPRKFIRSRPRHSPPATLAALALLAACIAATWPAAGEGITRNVILITLDGVRTQEMFGGLDRETFEAGDKKLEESPKFRALWHESPEVRRTRLMPFFWNEWMTRHGSIAGNPARGSSVQLRNQLWFSYPGYSEILTGRQNDRVIRSNDPVQNPRTTVLEVLRDRLGLPRESVAVFASWSVIRPIAEHKPGSLTINAGFEPWPVDSPEIQLLNELQSETATPWDSVRHDAYTFRFAMDHLRRHRPRVLYLSLGETDDWAHDKRYDRVLEALQRTDTRFQELWSWLESQPDYRGRTSILITTDHGRGRIPENWPHHRANLDGAGETWFAVISPDVSLRGEWTGHSPIYAEQFAATLARFVGVDFRSAVPDAGPPVAFPTP